MINLNGTLISKQESIYQNRALHYADALFETIRVQHNKILFWEAHYFRLMAGMRILRMEIPMHFTPEFLEKQIFNTLNAQPKYLANTPQAFRIKILVYRQWGGFYLPANAQVHYIIEAQPLKNLTYTYTTAPYEITLFRDHYLPEGLLANVKTTQRLVNVLGSIFASENGFQDALLLNHQKQVVESLQGNVFWVSGYKIKTPPLASGCIQGIMRMQILKILAEHPDYICEEAPLSPFEIQQADALFITNSIVGIQPVTRFRKKAFTTTVPEELHAMLLAHTGV